MQKLLLCSVLLVGAFLLIYRIDELMPFIGDQGWFYLSARNLIDGQFPLVGIASSHPWLHQGPLWTYLLALVLPLFHFNPLGGAYLSIVIGISTILLLFLVSRDMFNSKVAFIASFLFATSPLIVMHARMPYHTAPIPFFTILFLYSLWKVTNGKQLWLPVSILSLAILYNLELATIPFAFILVVVLVFGFIKKKKRFVSLMDKKVVVLSFFAFLIPMLPILIHDTQNGFPQTFKFAAWMGYKVLVVFGYPPLHPEISSPTWQSVIHFVAEQYQKLLYIDSSLVVTILFIFTFGYFYSQCFKQWKEKKYQSNVILLGLVLTVPLLAYFAAKTPSEAYMPMLFPTVILMTAFCFGQFLQTRLQTVIVVMILILMTFGNIYFLLSSNYSMSGTRYPFTMRINAAKYIISTAKGQEYNLKGNGEGSKFESFTMNYQYILWWLGNAPSNEKQKLQFTIHEEKDKIRVTKDERR